MNLNLKSGPTEGRPHNCLLPLSKPPFLSRLKWSSQDKRLNSRHLSAGASHTIKARPLLIVVCHPEGLPLNSSQTVPHWKARHIVQPWGQQIRALIGIQDTAGSALDFLHYTDCRVAFHECALYMLVARRFMFLHAWNSIYGPLKIQAIKFNIAMNTWPAGLRAREQAEAVNTHSPSSLHNPLSQSSQVFKKPSPPHATAEWIVVNLNDQTKTMWEAMAVRENIRPQWTAPIKEICVSGIVNGIFHSPVCVCRSHWHR